ncbi:mitochondrial carrier domain-containing protein [Peziza echinospora]|nr:mitochondrial carrier domain-containing protein [Peziza echinospora]
MGAMSKEAPLPPWGYAVAGATGAVIANALVYPLDIVKTKLQVQVKSKPEDAESGLKAVKEEHYTSAIDALQKIFAKEGPAGLYAGMAGSLIGVASTNFAYFYWYTIVRTFYLKRTKSTVLSTATELSLGAAAGALAQLFTIPVAVVTTRQQTSSKSERKGLLATAQDVITEDGISGLWRGLKASLVLVVNPSITYGAYQKLRTTLFSHKTHITPIDAFLLGAMSKTLATLATQPMIVAKVGLQSKPPPGVPAFKSFTDVLAYIIKHEGPAKLFKGIGPQITKGLLVQGFLMMTKERMELLFILLWRYWSKVRAERLAKGLASAAVVQVLKK